MSCPLSNLVDNLSEGLNSEKCADCKYRLDYMSVSYDKLILGALSVKRIMRKKINEELIKIFANTYEFCNKDIDKLILLLRKGVYPYIYMDSWKRFDQKALPDKKAFYSNLNTKDIAYIDYSHASRVFKKFKLKNLGEYHDLHGQSDTLLLADVFENFRGMCIRVYELDPVHFLSAPGSAWQACLKETGVELELITYPDMLLMVEKGIRGGICHAIYRYAKANNKYMKNYDE